MMSLLKPLALIGLIFFTQVGAVGAAVASAEAERFRLENDQLAAAWRLVDGWLVPEEIRNKLSAQKLPQAGTVLFRITLEDAKGDTRIVAASDLEPVGPPNYADIEAKPNAVRAAERVAGREINAKFRDGKSGTTIQWRAVLRDGANYLHMSIAMNGSESAARLRNVELLDVRGPGAVQVGSVPGSPVTMGQTFFGIELPFSTNQLSADGFRSSFGCNLPLGKGNRYAFSSVVGVVEKGQLRRGFLRYLEQERAVPYRPFLHYNCWYDLVRNMNETNLLATIAAFSKEMTIKRGAAIDSYVLDDGWDDPKLGFWAIDKSKFPAGFTPLSDALEKEHSRLGIWISPLGGYAWAGMRAAEARKVGLVRGKSLDLSDPKYYAWFRDYCANLMRKNRVNYFKWDKAGAGVSPHFMALLACADELRQSDPQLFLNVTAGTWPSPFWLRFIDSTWRDGRDMEFIGKGDEREKWLTYRDGQTYRGVVQRGPLYPLNSLMTGGIVHAKGLPTAIRSATAGNDLRHEARSFFGLGSNLQELYIQHDMMDAAAWDAVASAAKWAKKNADVLVDTHWVGGDPNDLEPYGFAAWSPRKAVLTLRNPDDQPREIDLDAAVAFELPKGAPGKYALTAAYEDMRVKTLVLESGKSITVRLEPFEVLVFDATGDADTLVDSVMEAHMNLSEAGIDVEIEEAVGDKGYHATDTLELANSLNIRTYIPEPSRSGEGNATGGTCRKRNAGRSSTIAAERASGYSAFAANGWNAVSSTCATRGGRAVELAAWDREGAKALPDCRDGPQPRLAHAQSVWNRDSEGPAGRGRPCFFCLSCLASRLFRSPSLAWASNVTPREFTRLRNHGLKRI